MRRGHALAARPGLSLDDYCAARHVRVSFAGRPRGFVDEALAREGRERQVMLTVNQFSTAARVVHESDLLTVLPRSFVPASGLADGLAVRPFPGTLPPIEVSLLWHRRHERDAAQRWLRQTSPRPRARSTPARRRGGAGSYAREPDALTRAASRTRRAARADPASRRR